MASRASRITRQVKPLLSSDKEEARHRVIALYKACYRQIPRVVGTYHVEFSIENARASLRKRFLANAHIKDIRVIDMLVIKGQQDLKEVVEHWAENTHIVNRMLSISDPYREEVVKKDFMSKFLSGH